MRCPFCHYEESKVTDSRTTEMGTIRRRRECLGCLRRFTTFETIDLTLQVRKRDGTYEDFQEEKMIKGIDAACCHSTVNHDQIRALVAKIKGHVLEKQMRQITAEELGEMVMQEMKKLDIVAYIRFACVYKRFKHIEQVLKAIDSAMASSPHLTNIKREACESCD